MDKKEIMMLKSTDLLQEQQQRHDFGVAVLEGVAVVLVADLGFREGLHRSTGRFHYFVCVTNYGKGMLLKGPLCICIM